MSTARIPQDFGNGAGLQASAVAPGDSATNTAADATVTYPASTTGLSNIVGDISFGYSGAATTGGFVSISDGASVIFKVPVTSNGAGQFTFSRPKKGTANTPMTVTITNGGPGTVGWVSATHWQG